MTAARREAPSRSSAQAAQPTGMEPQAAAGANGILIKMSSFKSRLTEALVVKGVLTKEQLSHVLKETQGGGKNFGRQLIERGLITEEKLFALLAEDLGIPTISLTKFRMDPAVIKLIPERVARQYNLIPISKFGERLVVAMSDPMNIFALDDLKMMTQYAVDPVMAPEAEIRRAIEQAYATSTGILELTAGDLGGVGEGQLDETSVHVALELLSEQTDEAPVVRAINLMIIEALRKRASDIHLEPMANGLRIRYRIDGQLKAFHQLPKQVQSIVLTRLKIMSGLDITEWRLPQDGRFKVRLEGREVDFRVSLLPITHGGKVVMRVLDKSSLSLGLDHLGFMADSIAAFKEAVCRPFGMILVTGPTGSGKSTTLYSVLNQLNNPTRNITTIEDPVEYQVEGITQVQVNPEIGMTFANGLRALLRQSPDVVMIGEIRDFETADIAMKASLTGQLVLSTLHTNDASSAVTRLVDMGVEPFLVASSVTLIEAQRLVRKLCQKCKVQMEPSKELLKRLGYTPDREATFYEAKGCHSCNESGYKGRMGILEVVLVDEHIRELIVSKAPSWEIKQYAVEHLKMCTLRDDGLRKAAAGQTALEEVVQVTTEE